MLFVRFTLRLLGAIHRILVSTFLPHPQSSDFRANVLVNFSPPPPHADDASFAPAPILNIVTQGHTLMCILRLRHPSSFSLLFYVTSPPTPLVFLGPLCVWLGHTKNPPKLVTDIFDAFSPHSSFYFFLFYFFCIRQNSCNVPIFPCPSVTEKPQMVVVSSYGECTHYGWKKMEKRGSSVSLDITESWTLLESSIFVSGGWIGRCV